MFIKKLRQMRNFVGGSGKTYYGVGVATDDVIKTDEEFGACTR